MHKWITKSKQSFRMDKTTDFDGCACLYGHCFVCLPYSARLEVKWNGWRSRKIVPRVAPFSYLHKTCEKQQKRTWIFNDLTDKNGRSRIKITEMKWAPRSSSPETLWNTVLNRMWGEASLWRWAFRQVTTYNETCPERPSLLFPSGAKGGQNYIAFKNISTSRDRLWSRIVCRTCPTPMHLNWNKNTLEIHQAK